MARVAVVHNTLDFQGGADAVCLHACAALQDRHDVTLFTVSETAPSDLAARFGVAVDVDVRSPPGATAVARGLAAAAPWLGPQLAFRSLLVGGYVRRVAGRFDAAVSTANEFALPLPSVQYVHYPQFNSHRLEEASGGRLNRLWTRLAGLTDPRTLAVPPGDDGDTTLLANSAWTADAVARVYGRRPTVVHPPVDPIPDGAPWKDREDGVVVVGRLAPDKRLLDAVRIVDGVRKRGHDLHLHVVGAAPRAYRRYADRIETAATERPHVSLERDVDRSRLLTLLRTHKYGLNTKSPEPFGMGLAEYVAAGMVAFAPTGGGQQEVLAGRSDRLFGTIEEAVDLLAAAAAADDPPTLPRDRFASERFRAAIREHVERAVN